jgi:hypothetical protein
MADSRWFDTLCTTLARHTPRRTVLRWAGLLTPALALGGTPETAAGNQNRKKGKGKGKGNNHKKPNKPHKPKPPKPPDDSDIPAICNRAWPYPDQEADREWCKFIWEQCPPGGDEQFCIVRNGGPFSSKIADCCNTGEACCRETCRDIWSDSLNCGGCDRSCLLNETCIAGECFCDLDLYDECSDGCVNTLRDPNNCGSCGTECPFWTVCINGECKCPPGRVPCDANPNLPYPDCIRPNDVCCFPYVCSGGGLCCYDANGYGHCLTECPDGWNQGAP